MEVSTIIRLVIYAFLGLGVAMALYNYFEAVNKSVILAILLIAFLVWQDMYFNISFVGFLMDIHGASYIHMLVMGLLSLFFMMSILNPKNKNFKYYYKLSVFTLIIGSLMCHLSSAIGFDIGLILLSK